MPDWRAVPSTLYVVATPIGNRDDLGLRAAEVLGAVDWVAAEDTRHTRKLIAGLPRSAPLRSLHRGNEMRMVSTLVRQLADGESGALVSDAGTPLISDPGQRLVEKVLGVGLLVVSVPGPSAVAAALSVAGFDAARFVFEGFLPARAAARQARIKALVTETRTWVVYEAPHRIRALLGDLAGLLESAREIAWVREMTKRHEEIWRGPVSALDVGAVPERGEFVVVVEGAQDRKGVAPQELDAFLQPLLQAGVGVSVAAALARECLGAVHRQAYKRALQIKDAL